MKQYIIDGNKHKEVDLLTWAKWFENTENRRIAYSDSPKGWSISTVFLGIDHSFGEGEEMLYETMVFNSGTELDGEPFRYSTREKAEEGHEEIRLRIVELTKD